MEHDTGRTAMWICGAMLGLLRQRGLISDPDLNALSRGLEREAESASDDARADMLAAARWLRHSVGVAND